MLRNPPEKSSKQAIIAKKMFGNRKGKHGMDLQIGKKFKKKGKGIMHGAVKTEGVGPSAEEFDDMMTNTVKEPRGIKKVKKSMFSRKQFG